MGQLYTGLANASLLRPFQFWHANASSPVLNGQECVAVTKSSHLAEGSLIRRMAMALMARLTGMASHSVIHKLLQGLHTLSPWVMGIGILMLFQLCMMAGTGLIGLASWALLGISVLCALASGVLNHTCQIPLSWQRLDGLVILFFASAAISCAFSSYQPMSVMGLAKFLTFFAAFLAFRIGVERLKPGLVIGLAVFLVLLGCFETWVGWLQYHDQVGPLATWVDPETNPELTMTRVFGTIKPYNPNLLAGFLAPCLGLAMGLTGWLWAKPRFSKLGWVGLLVCAALMGGMVLTGSRGGFLAIAGMMAFTVLGSGHLIFHAPELKAYQGYKKLWLVLVLGALLLMVLGVASSEKIQHRLMSIFSFWEDSSIAYRLRVYESAWRMFLDNLWVGIGPGNDTFKQVYGMYMTPGFNALGSYSVPLEIAVEQGLLGLLISGLLTGTVLYRSALVLDSVRIALCDKWLSLMWLLPLVGITCHGLFDTVWYRPAVNLTFWFILAGFIVTTGRLFRERSAKTDTLEPVS